MSEVVVTPPVDADSVGERVAAYRGAILEGRATLNQCRESEGLSGIGPPGDVMFTPPQARIVSPAEQMLRRMEALERRVAELERSAVQRKTCAACNGKGGIDANFAGDTYEKVAVCGQCGGTGQFFTNLP